MRRTLPVLAMVALLAAPLAGCSGKPSHSAAPAATSSSGIVTDGPNADDPSADPTASLDGGDPVPAQSAADAQVAKSKVGQLMAKLGCSGEQLVETDPLSLETGMCEMSGDIIVAVFASDAKRDEWVAQSRTSGLGTVVGPLWAVGVEVDTDTPTVVTKLGGTAK